VTDSPSVAKSPAASRRGGLEIVAASGVAALATIVVTVVAARVLSVADYARFIAYWSLLFGLIQIVSGTQNEAARAMSPSSAEAAGGRARGSRVLVMPLVIGGGLAVVAGLAALVRGRHVDAGLTVGVVLATMVVVVGYACEATVLGTLTGRRQWGWVATVNATEAVVRMSAVAIVGFALHSLGALQFAAALPSLVWLLLSVWARPVRQAAFARTEVSWSRLVGNGMFAVVSSAAGAVLVNGFPAIVRMVLHAHVPVAQLVVLLLLIQLTRAPLMIPLTALQGVVVTTFVAHSGRRLGVLLKAFGLVLAIGVVLALAAGLVGPWAISLLYGAQYQVSFALCATFTFAAIPLGMLTLSGAAALAIGEHRSFAAGWVVAAVATVLLLWLPVPVLIRPAVAVLGGPLLGVVVHLVAIWRRDARPAAQEQVATVDPGASAPVD